MKKLIKEYLFEKLLLLIFKFSDTHKLIKFEKIPRGERIYYKFEVRSILGVQEEVEKHVEEHLKNESVKNSLKWENEGFYLKSTFNNTGELLNTRMLK